MSGDKFKRSRELYEQAQRYLPGGVDSPVRAHKAVGAMPLFIERAKGSKIYDADHHEYIDYVCSWGPLILGHARPEVIHALKKAAERGTSFGISTELEIKLAKMIQRGHAFDGNAALRQFRDGSDHDRPASGAGFHRAR